MRLRRPRILITPWRRVLPTWLGATDLFTLAPEYTDRVREAGGLPLIAPHLDAAELAEVLDDVDAVLLSGGQDVDPAVYGAENTASILVRPESDEFDLRVALASIERGLPVLGVCRGPQVLNVALGGDLRQEVQSTGDPAHPTYAEMAEMEDVRDHRHEIRVVGGSRLEAVIGGPVVTVNSLHHQAIGRVADGLVVSATAPDGTIEAVEGIDADVLAVQWHPEMMDGAATDRLFDDLVERARARLTAGIVREAGG